MKMRLEGSALAHIGICALRGATNLNEVVVKCRRRWICAASIAKESSSVYLR
jgi:hypothetical protein